MFLNFVYGLVLLACSPLLLYRALRQGKYRQGWSAKLWGLTSVPPACGPRFWFHAVSVGEVNLLAGLTRALLAQLPSADIVVSTTTSTGFALAQQRFPPERVFYCPLDFTWATRRALQQVRPDCIVLAELEVWPNWIRAARQRNVPVVVVNGRLSLRSFRGYQRIDYLVKTTFARLSLVAAQNKTYAERFIDLGTDSTVVRVTGSTKFDDAPASRDTETIHHYRRLVAATADQTIWIAGSTQAGEETIVLRAYRQLMDAYPQLRLIVVPRHAERFEAVAQEIEQAGFVLRRRSELHQPVSVWEPNQVVLIDTIGELRSWWGLADVAFVGGSMGSRGGQNMLEPAGYGAAVCFGPHTHNFRDMVVELLQRNAAAMVADEEALMAFVRQAIEQPATARQMGARAQQFIQQHQGATQRTIQLLLELIHRTLVLSPAEPNADDNHDTHGQAGNRRADTDRDSL